MPGKIAFAGNRENKMHKIRVF